VAQIETSHGVRFDLGAETTSEPALMDRRMIANLASLAQAQGITPEIMPCGAGHDAAVFAKAGVPTGMIFIRNANGSHNPDEAMDISDFAAAAQILSAFCLQDLTQIS
jgi:N-carbamoyl-L-amino-acid hydrolase